MLNKKHMMFDKDTTINKSPTNPLKWLYYDIANGKDWVSKVVRTHAESDKLTCHISNSMTKGFNSLDYAEAFVRENDQKGVKVTNHK